MAETNLGGLGILAAAAAGAFLLLRDGDGPQTGAQDGASGTPDDTPPGVSEELDESVTDAAETAWTGAKEFVPDDRKLGSDGGSSGPVSPIMQDAIDAGASDPSDTSGTADDPTSAFEETRDAINSPDLGGFEGVTL